MWKTADLGKRYLEGVRGAIPFAAEQIATLLFLIQQGGRPPRRFLDLGCGDGILGHAVLEQYPQAAGVFLDFSDTMIQAARQRLAGNSGQVAFLSQDYGLASWVRSVASHAPFDVIVSGFSIHHQTDARKHELYGELFRLLAPGGWFLNLEHVASGSARMSRVFDEYFIDALHRHHVSEGGALSREQVAETYYRRPDKAANILAPVDLQCQWLRDLGFQDVDCYFKIFELALFGGQKPV